MKTIEDVNTVIAAAHDMHRQLGLRDNLSTQTVAAMAANGKPMNDAFAAALLTLGGAHAPIEDACKLFMDDDIEHQRAVMNNAIWAGRKVPGFGSSIVKGEPDPILTSFNSVLPVELLKRMEILSDLLHEIRGGKKTRLYPNAALYTAMFAEVLGVMPEHAMALVIQGRTPVWIDTFAAHFSPRPQI